MLGTTYYNGSLGISVPDGLADYLRSLLRLTSYGTLNLQRPQRDYHITICCEPYETVSNPGILSLEFEVSLELYTNGNAFWVPVVSQDIENLRESLGLSRICEVPVHFCVGYIKNGKLC